MTDKEKAICTAYTGVSFFDGEFLNPFFDYILELLKRPISGHELGEEDLWISLKELSKEDFLKVCAGEYEDEGKKPKKPVNIKPYIYDADTTCRCGSCPVCGRWVNEISHETYCPACAQALDWSEDDEESLPWC